MHVTETSLHSHTHTQEITGSNSGLVQGLCQLQRCWPRMLRWCHGNLFSSISGPYFPFLWLHSPVIDRIPPCIQRRDSSAALNWNSSSLTTKRKEAPPSWLFQQKLQVSCYPGLGHMSIPVPISDQRYPQLQLVKSGSYAYPQGIVIVSDQPDYRNLRKAVFHKGKSKGQEF